MYYEVNYKIDAIDIFDELSRSEKIDFLKDAIRGLDYEDDLIVIRDASELLNDGQKVELIEDVFGYIEGESRRLDLISRLTDDLSTESMKELIEELTQKTSTL